MKPANLLVLAVLVGVLANVAICDAQSTSKKPYEPDWESLKRHEIPEWFKDAKFGIYTHWGPVTVGAEDGPGGVQWYGRNMYMPKSPTFRYHREKYGDQNKVGYKDMIPMFKAEEFDAEEWAELFARAGAKFAGPVAIHHDNFAMWDSALTEWDSVDKGPKRDITGELQRAIQKRGMKFIATFHHAFSWRYFEPSYEYDGATPGYEGLYCQPHETGAPPTKEFQELYLSKVDEVVNNYQPDLIWFDFGLGNDDRNCITPEYRKRMFADYYNWAAANGIEVGVAHKHPEIHQYTGILDFERGREDRLTPYPWLTDTSIGPWFHQKSTPYKPVNEIVDVLVDIVSKNGCMLLNVGPDAAGRIPKDAQEILLGIGNWLDVNGEAIYGTRPWKIFGEGPTEIKGGGFSERKSKASYTEEDIRFTTKGKALYAICLGWPGERVNIKSLAEQPAADARKISSVRMLGVGKKLKWSHNEEGLSITLPKSKPCEHAFALKITF